MAFFYSFFQAQTFEAKGGIIEDATVEVFSRKLFPVEISDLPVSIDCGQFGINKVCINIDHERLSDLKVTLLSPDGTEVWLTNRNGHTSRGYSNTCFSLEATDGFVYNGTSRFRGNFIPDGNLNNLNNGQDPNGIWYIAVEDLQEGYFGFFRSFSLSFSDQVPCDPSLCELENINDCECPDPSMQDCQLLPDLMVLENNTRNHIQYFPSTDEQYPNQLRFSASMANIGHGPLEVRPINEYFCDGRLIADPSECSEGRLTQTISQYIYHKKGDSFSIDSAKANSWYFDTQRGHNHYHVEDWTDFRLLRKKWWTNDPEKWKVIAESSKVSYCLMDSNLCLEEEQNCKYKTKAYFRDNLINYGLGHYFRCEQKVQGISVGAVDTYGLFYEGQYIDIPTSLKLGKYYLYIVVDPKNYYQELNEQNNSILIPLSFEKSKAGIMSFNLGG